jgi:hypothetical protein
MKRAICVLAVLAGLASAQDKPLVLALNSPGAAINLELTVYLVSGLAEAQAAVKDEVPQDLAATLQQLRGVFAYKSYRLIDAVTLRGRNNGGAEVAGELPDYSHYDFRYIRARISPETPHMVRLDGLRLEIARRHADRVDNVALVSTDLDIRDGQKTVVGKSAVNGKDALFLVIVPKVVE